MRISIFGLGYVGAVSAGCLARDGHDVVGCDVDPTKLALLRDGRTPIIEEGMTELIAGAVSSGRLRVTDDTAEALRSTDLSFLCVGTPSRPNGGQDLGAVRRLAEQIGQALREKAERHAFVVRSTVLPGTVRGVVAPLLQTHSEKRPGVDFGVCFQPEFLREGSSIRDYDQPPFTVVGVDDDWCATMLREVFGHLPGEFVVTDVGTAEMLKFCCNAFHALKITFANEVGRLCQAMEVDSHAVMDLLCRDRRLNISPAYLKPGFAFGGSCLPKDVRALVHAGKRLDVETPALSALLPSNQLHIEHAGSQDITINVTSDGKPLTLEWLRPTSDITYRQRVFPIYIDTALSERAGVARVEIVAQPEGEEAAPILLGILNRPATNGVSVTWTEAPEAGVYRLKAIARLPNDQTMTFEGPKVTVRE